MNKLSICIPHLPYDASINEIMDEAIRRYVKYTKAEFEICLVINGGKGYTPPENGSLLRVVHFDKPIGNPSGWNEALKMASGDIIAFMDSDVWVEENWDGPLINALENLQTGIVIPIVHRQEKDGRFTIIDDNCQGCATIMRRDTLDILETKPPDKRVEKCFGYDSLFDPAYAEDTDLFLRVKLCGWKRHVVRESTVLHLNGATTQTVFKDHEEVAKVSRRKFEKKWEHLGLDKGVYKAWSMWV